MYNTSFVPVSFHNHARYTRSRRVIHDYTIRDFLTVPQRGAMRSLILLVPISTHALRAASCTSKNKPYHRQVVVAVQGASAFSCALLRILLHRRRGRRVACAYHGVQPRDLFHTSSRNFGYVLCDSTFYRFGYCNV